MLALEPAGGDPGTIASARCANFEPTPRQRHSSALSAMDWRENPNRTSGNEGVPLQ
ncbi:hypothetical protein RGR602_CH03540 [Rhizobium gallicum bv. gallicum R602sp]|uniref:Uncharacterized protein n=1 Tax=Rhizobium gallicum bv. gallicum R602sp TaxID=1041138 RepID=A0A0B4X8K5_9HYPH|nr:hypothetical protein RGR602_CH03540 [Rhizobium gallicum bv. gallicum R602sp]